MTNEQINRMAAEALGMCWHSWDKYATCSECGEFLTETSDFCDDLNAAQRLLKSITVDHEGIGFNVTLPILLKYNEWYRLTPRRVILTSAKTITLACLVVLGKITLKEAKESL